MAREKGERQKSRRRFYFRNAFGASSAAEYLERTADATRETIDVVRPKQGVDRRGFFGRDRDGGIERFRAMSDHLTHDEILDLIFAWERDRTVFLLGMTGAILAIPISGIYGIGNWYFVFGLLLLTIFCCTKAMQADFSAWRLRQGRMAPLVDYLNNRLPSNMQIMED